MSTSAIPIRNLYYLFLYAWEKFPEGKGIEVGQDSGPELPNLLARVLLSCVKSLLRRSLVRDYQPIVEDLAGPRGRFLLADSFKKNTLVAGRIVCAFDELTTDTHPNRIIKAALKALGRSPDVNSGLRTELNHVARCFAAVSDVRLSRQLFRSLQIRKDSGRYGLAIQICRLLTDLLLPQEDGTNARFADILQDEVRMSTIFESFIRNFYRAEQTTYSANAESVEWDLVCSPEMRRFVPDMRTDVTLRSSAHIIVIDAKFYKQTLVSRFPGGQPKVQSSHLYQLQSYLRHSAAHEAPSTSVEGVLLYPSIDGEDLRIELEISGHRVRVSSIDFSREWQHLHQALLSLLDSSFDQTSKNGRASSTLAMV